MADVCVFSILVRGWFCLMGDYSFNHLVMVVFTFYPYVNNGCSQNTPGILEL